MTWERRLGNAPGKSLFLINEMPAAVLLPASLVALSAERLLFAVADRLDAAGVNSPRSQCVLHRRGTLVAQGQVVLSRAALVAGSLDGEVDAGMLVQKRDVSLHRSLLVGANVRLVIVEVNVLDALREQLLFGRPGSRWWGWRWRLCDRDPCRG